MINIKLILIEVLYIFKYLIKRVRKTILIFHHCARRFVCCYNLKSPVKRAYY